MHFSKKGSSHFESSPKCFFFALFHGCSSNRVQSRRDHESSPLAQSGVQSFLCGKRAVLSARQASASRDRDAELHMAEKECAAFYSAVLKEFGQEEAFRATQNWIELVEKQGVLSNWRQATIFASEMLATRVINPLA